MELHCVPLSLSPQSLREDEDTFFKCQVFEVCGGTVGAVKSGLLAAMACGSFGPEAKWNWWIWVKIRLPWDCDIS